MLNGKKKIRLLVVDDSLGYCEEIKEYAEMCKHEFDMICEFAQSGEEALRLINTWGPSVMLLDAHAFSADCFALLDKCSKEAVPVIVTSDYRSPDIQGSSISRGASAYVPRAEDPEEIENLLHCIESLSIEYASRH